MQITRIRDCYFWINWDLCSDGHICLKSHYICRIHVKIRGSLLYITHFNTLKHLGAIRLHLGAYVVPRIQPNSAIIPFHFTI